MGIGDSIEEAAKNAIEDLAGTAPKSDDAHTPDPGDPKEDIRVHSSISEGSNATDPVDPVENPPGTAPEPPQTSPENTPPLDAPAGSPTPSETPAPQRDDASQHDEATQHVPGPAGLPDSDPGELRADPSEAGGDPTTSMGRG